MEHRPGDTTAELKKRKKSVSPTKRTLDALRDEGWMVAVVERWNQYAGIRQDLFGFIDVVAVKDSATLAVQATSATNHAARRTKAVGLEAVKRWLSGGTRTFEIWSWAKRKGRWVVRREAIGATHED